MRIRAWAICALAALAAPAMGQQAGADPFVGAVEQQAAMQAPGAQRAAPFMPGAGPRTDWTVTLEVGRCYWFIGASSVETGRLSLYLWSPDGRRATEAKPRGTWATMAYCAAYSGAYHVQAKVDRPGYYVVGQYTRLPAGPPAFAGAPPPSTQMVVEAPPPVDAYGRPTAAPPVYAPPPGYAPPQPYAPQPYAPPVYPPPPRYGNWQVTITPPGYAAPAYPSDWRTANAVMPGSDCRTGSDGIRVCGYNCRIGANGHMYCSGTPDGDCRLRPDGAYDCPPPPPSTGGWNAPPARRSNKGQRNDPCSSSLDCDSGLFCREVDGYHSCM